MYETGPWQMSFGWGHVNTDNGNGAATLATIAQGTTPAARRCVRACPGHQRRGYFGTNPLAGAATFGGYTADKFEIGVNYALGPGIKLVGGGMYWNVGGPGQRRPRASPGLPCWAWTCASSRRPDRQIGKSGRKPALFIWADLAADQVDEQGRQVGARHRQALGRLAGQHGAIVLVVEHELEQALLDGAGPRLELGLAVALHAIGDVEPDIAAAVERRQDLQPLEQQHQAAHREAPIIVGRGMEGLRPWRRDIGQAAGPQQGLDVAGGPLRRRRVCSSTWQQITRSNGLRAERRP